MTLPDFSVLLLAWDDADPQVAVLGGSALPPTLPLVYQLAAQHPVLALYPHLPAAENSVPSFTIEVPILAAAPSEPEAVATTEDSATPTSPATISEVLTATVAQPGVQLLPPPAVETKTTKASAPLSRIIGLDDLVPAEQPLVAATENAAVTRNVAPATTAGKAVIEQSITTIPARPGRSQWPTGINAPVLTGQWQAPAAPYLGAGSGGFFPPPPPAPPRPASLKAALIELGATNPTAPARSTSTPAEAPTTPPAPPLKPRQTLPVGDLNFDPDPELPAVVIRQPILFDEPTEEVGAGEANDISAPEDDIVPDAPALPEPFPLPELAQPTPEPAAPTPHMPQLEGLNFRMIQYARQAAQLVQHRPDFGVIYAPNWPAWLAALEIRNSSRQPLVLYVAALANDFAGPAERGWLPELERMNLRRATLVLVPDATVQRRLRTLYGEATGEIRIVAADDEAAVQRLLGEVTL